MENDNLFWVENSEGRLLQAHYVPGLGEGRRKPVFIVDKVTNMEGLLELQNAFGSV
jgi:hypothetical protein